MWNLFGGVDRNRTCQTCWAELPYGFKFLFLFTLGYNALSVILSFLITSVYFDAYMTVHQFQIWRLFFSFIPAGMFPGSILNILINFLWLLSFLPLMQKKLSTTYLLVEIFIQNLLINLVLSVIGILIYWVFGFGYYDFPIYNLGLFPIIMIFIWYQVSQDPQKHTTFCCMPCLIPMKWIPYIVLGFSFILAGSLFMPLLVAFVLGYFQFMYLRRRFIKLPLKIYRKLDSWFPQSVRSRPDFIKVSDSQTSLRHECSEGSLDVGGNNANPFRSRNRNQNNENSRDNQQLQQKNDKVQVFGKGVSIGGNSQSQNFKGFWASKQQPSNQIQIQPASQNNPYSQQHNKSNQNPFSQNQPYFQQQNSNSNPYQYSSNNNNNNNTNPYQQNPFHVKKQQQQPNHFYTQNDSHVGFKLTEPDDKQSEQELGEKQEKKVAKKNLLE